MWLSTLIHSNNQQPHKCVYRVRSNRLRATIVKIIYIKVVSLRLKSFHNNMMENLVKRTFDIIENIPSTSVILPIWYTYPFRLMYMYLYYDSKDDKS